MENAETILVVVLSTFLAIFLVLSIVLLIKCIQITNQVKRLTDKAEQLVDTTESVGEFFHKASGNFAAGRVVAQVVNSVLNHHEGNKRKDK